MTPPPRSRTGPAPRVFPLQVAVLLSQPGEDFSGGEFVMTETHAGHARADVPSMRQGDAVVFAVHERPVAGPRGRLRMPAQRHSRGVIFHDAQ